MGDVDVDVDVATIRRQRNRVDSFEIRWRLRVRIRALESIPLLCPSRFLCQKKFEIGSVFDTRKRKIRSRCVRNIEYIYDTMVRQ